MQPQLQGNKASTSHDQANIQRRRSLFISTCRLCCCHPSAQDASICGKTRSRLAYALMSSTESRHKTTVVFQTTLEGPVKASIAVGWVALPPQQRSSKTPSGYNRMLPKLLPVGARLASAQTGTITSHSGPGLLCFIPSTVSQETRGGAFENIVEVQARSCNADQSRRTARPAMLPHSTGARNGPRSLKEGRRTEVRAPDLDPSIRSPQLRSC